MLSGVICKTPEHSESPAGIPHTVLVLEHKSIQQEAGLNRQAYARIQVILSGTALAQQTQTLMLGNMVKVTGFLNRHKHQSGQTKLVLHARQIEQIS